jgi:molecular chaperone DnaJ
MSKRDYYEVLGLKKGASDSDIKKAYRSLAKKLHPDAGGNDESFKELSEAYETLSDSDKKANYDNFGHQTEQRQRSSRTERYYHNYRQEQKVGDNMNLLIKITLEEAFTGVKKTYKYKRNDKCDVCSGHGGADVQECPSCNGRGFIIQQIQTPMGVFSNMFPCHNCDGNGSTVKTPCDTCKSTGLKSVEETIEVNIPPGVQEGMTFVMAGKGNAIKGGECGNLHINIMELPHDLYVRNGNDLKMTLKLSYSQLVLGDKIDIQTIEGSKIRISVPEHSDVGTNLRIQNKGMKAYGKDNRGDLILSLGIDIPKTITSEAKEMLEKLKKL